MTTHKKNSYFVSALLFVLIVLSTMNLLSCGGSNSAPVIYSMSPTGTKVTSSSGAPAISNVTLIGANFGTIQGTGSYVFFNNVLTSASVWTDTTIVAAIPSVAANSLTTGTAFSVPVVVNVNSQVSNAVTFTYIGS